MNRCEGCEGHGYVGPLRPNLPACQVCKGTGRGHVHAWEYKGVLPSTPTAVRECRGCDTLQATHIENLAEVKSSPYSVYGSPYSLSSHEFKFPKEYLAIADVTWSPCTEWEIGEVKRAMKGRKP